MARLSEWTITWSLVLCVIGTPSIAVACKYNVRDVAFVNLGSNTYRLFVYTPETPQVENLRRASAVLGDSNVKFRIVPIDDGIAAASADDPALVHIRTHKISTFPAAVLVSPEGRSEVVLPELKPDQSFEAIWSAMETLVASPTRDKLLDLILETHSVVLVIEGDNAAHNQRAREIASGAIQRITESLADLPKAIAQPPHRLVLRRDDAARERLLLWSLNVDDSDPAAAHIVVLFGRARRLGPVLTVPGATQNELTRNLSYVGQDCECELDRSWMQGPMIPHQWGTEKEAQAVKQLGFDPGSPLVQSEISRILARGPSSRPQDSGYREAEFLDPLLGYEEIVIDDLPDTDPTVLPDTVSTGLPDTVSTGLPDTVSTGLPDTVSTGLPDTVSTGLPDTDSTGDSPLAENADPDEGPTSPPVPAAVDGAVPSPPETVTTTDPFGFLTIVVAGLALVALLGGGLILTRGRRDF